MNMVRQVWEKLTAPHPSIEDHAEKEQAHLAASLTTAMIPAILSGLFVTPPGSALPLLGVAGVLIVAYFLSRSRFFQVGCWLAAFSLFIPPVMISFRWENQASTLNHPLVWLAFPLIFASLLLSIRHFLLFIVISIAAVYFVYSQTPMMKMAHLIILLVFVGFAGSFLLLHNAIRERYQRKLKAHSQFLEEQVSERTKELQAFSQALKQIHQLHTTSYSSTEEIFKKYLQTGKELFHLDHGIISHIQNDQYQIIAVDSDLDIVEGAMLALDETYCREVIKAGTTIIMEDVGEVESMQCHPIYLSLQLLSYISAPILVNGKVYGTLNFSSKLAREEPFEEYEVEMLELMAQGIGYFISSQQASQAKSEFLSTMSHEMRTPLNAIIGMTEIIETTSLSDEQAQYLSAISDGGDALLSVINNVLDFSKLEQHRAQVEMHAFNLQELIEKSIQVLAVTAHQKQLELMYHLSETVPLHLIGDSTKLNQLFYNLLGNAIKFTDSGSVQLQVHLEEAEADQVVLHFSVKDTGAGIEKTHLVHIFDRFSQADASTTRKFGGTGLGLAICKKIVELMGGKIWVDSTLNEGSCFHFTLPFQISPSELPTP